MESTKTFKDSIDDLCSDNTSFASNQNTSPVKIPLDTSVRCQYLEESNKAEW